MRRRRLIGVVGGVTAFGLATLALHLLGVGGYRGGFMWSALVLGGLGGVGTWFALRQSSGVVWGLAVAIAGAAVAGALMEAAPLSHGRLAEETDDLDLPFFEVVEERRSGHSWCRPHCPAVTRVYDPPDVSPSALAVTTASAFIEKGLIDQEQLQSLVGRDDDFQLVAEDYTIDVTIDGDRVTIRYESVR